MIKNVNKYPASHHHHYHAHHHHDDEPCKNKKPCGSGGHNSKVKFNYEHLLTANLDLNEYVSKGKNLFFDCKPMQFDDIDLLNLSEQDYERYLLVDENGEITRPNKPYLKWVLKQLPAEEKQIFDPALSPKSEKKKFIEEQVETEDENIYKRQLFPYWSMICKQMYGHTGKSNLIDTAYEGGFRLERRFKNMDIAFTYGYKLKYEDLDDPYLEQKIKDFIKNREK